jgi:FtsP/CotA-like multicopper oxidase with cupredoxin domain
LKISRRVFLKLGVSTAGSFLIARFGAGRVFALPIEPTLDPTSLPKFVTALLVPPVMPKAATIPHPGGKPIDYYEISMRQITQQILPAGQPATTVWGYGATKASSKKGLLIHHAPSLTIEALWKQPVRVKWINELRLDPADPTSPFLPHLLPVDPTLHWANPPGGVSGRDMRPTFNSTPGAYTGPVPIVTHVHGSVGVGDESDGYAEAWHLPVAGGIPSDYARTGTWYDFFRDKASAQGFVTPGSSAWDAGSAVFQYLNDQRASTIWYHDHTLGMTRLNVYAGPAGFFIVRGGPSGDKSVLDSRTGLTAVLPGPAPIEGDKFPPNKTYFEIPMAIQDRSFNADGSLFYPDSREFFDGIAGPYIPDTDVSPIWNPEFFGDAIMVNGNTWPFHTVEQRRYRFRLLNGCDARFLILDFSQIPGVEVWQIGNEGGFLAAPVDLTANHANRLLMSPAERADVIVDFTHVPVGSFVLRNLGPDEPFSGGEPPGDFEVADPATTGQILRFDVVPPAAADPTTPPAFLQLPPLTPLPAATSTRRLALLEKVSEFFEDAPVEAQLGTVSGDPNTGAGTWVALGWEEPISENPAPGATEIWEFYNATADAHPIHIHEIAFEVVDRQAILIDEDASTVQVDTDSAPRPPEPWELGFKDTVIAYPGEVTRVRATFGKAGQFVWHCHIVEHEDNEMMRPYRIGPPQPGQPS